MRCMCVATHARIRTCSPTFSSFATAVAAVGCTRSICVPSLTHGAQLPFFRFLPRIPSPYKSSHTTSLTHIVKSINDQPRDTISPSSISKRNTKRNLPATLFIAVTNLRLELPLHPLSLSLTLFFFSFFLFLYEIELVSTATYLSYSLKKVCIHIHTGCFRHRALSLEYRYCFSFDLRAYLI